MAHVDRFSVSLDTELLGAFDRHIAAHGYVNRSEAIRDLIRDLLLAGRLEDENTPVLGFIVFHCGNEAVDARERLRQRFAERADLVRATMSVTVKGGGEGLCVAVSGTTRDVRALANALQGIKGVTHAHLVLMPAEQDARQPY
jgi:CopG family nickel-responsive transcriptional regulator